MSELKPLLASWVVNDLEGDNRDLFAKVYKQELKELADEINVYGAPHLGDMTLISRHVAADGLALQNDADEARMRAIFKAWRYLNPERGLHFLNFYLRLLYPSSAAPAVQMWQKKTLPYTVRMKTREQIIADGEAETDYFLTSRVRVQLDGNSVVQDKILRALRTTLAARFVLEIQFSRFFAAQAGAVGVAGTTCILNFTGDCA